MRRNRVVVVHCLAIVAGIFGGSVDHSLAVAEGITIEQISDGWARRSKSIESISMHLVEKRTDHPGSFYNDSDPEGIYPETKTVVSHEASLQIASGRWLYETNGQDWSSAHGRLVRSRRVESFDGSGLVILYEIYPSNGRGSEHAVIFPGSGPRSVVAPSGWLVSAVFPQNPSWSRLDDGKWRVVETASVNGREAVMIERMNNEKELERCWLDIKDDFAPLRRSLMFRRSRDGENNPWRLYWQADVEYQRDLPEGSLPTRWIERRFTTSRPSRLTLQRETVVEAYSVNRPIPEAKLRFEIPDGIQVSDYTVGQIPRVYIAGSDAETVSASQSGDDVSADPIPGNLAGRNLQGRSGPGALVAIAAAVMLLVAVAAGIFVRRARDAGG